MTADSGAVSIGSLNLGLRRCLFFSASSRSIRSSLSSSISQLIRDDFKHLGIAAEDPTALQARKLKNRNEFANFGLSLKTTMHAATWSLARSAA